MVAHSETAAALPAGQAQLTAQARKRIRQRVARKASAEGRALLKKHRQKRDRKRYKKKPKRDTMPNQHRKQLTLAKEHTSCALAIPQLPPETPPPQQTGTNPDVSPKKSDVSGSAPFASTCTRPKEDSP